MLTRFPQAVPEIPVSDVEKAAAYYVKVLGFHFDWGDNQNGIGGISHGDCRMFLTNAAFRKQHGLEGMVAVWLNLGSKREVDELCDRWREAGAKILEGPEDKPWNLQEFKVADLDGNQVRVFYDFSWESRQGQSQPFKKNIDPGELDRALSRLKTGDFTAYGANLIGEPKLWKPFLCYKSSLPAAMMFLTKRKWRRCSSS